jgi:hypothetical protein
MLPLIVIRTPQAFKYGPCMHPVYWYGFLLPYYAIASPYLLVPRWILAVTIRVTNIAKVRREEHVIDFWCKSMSSEVEVMSLRVRDLCIYRTQFEVEV